MLESFNGPVGRNFLHFVKNHKWVLTKDGEVIGEGNDMFSAVASAELDGNNLKAYRVVSPNGVSFDIPSVIKIDMLR